LNIQAHVGFISVCAGSMEYIIEPGKICNIKPS